MMTKTLGETLIDNARLKDAMRVRYRELEHMRVGDQFILIPERSGKGNNILDSPGQRRVASRAYSREVFGLAELLGIRDLMVLVSVLDDTGTHEDAAYSSCIGVVAGRQHWRRFEREWSRELIRFGVEDFHAKRFYARDSDGQRVGQFRGWDDIKARDFIQSMVSLLGSMKAEIVGAAVNRATFRELPERERAFWTGQVTHGGTGKRIGTGAPNKPFILAFGIAVQKSLEHAKGNVPVGIILDKTDAFAAQASVICSQLNAIGKYPGKIEGFYQAERNQFVPLHLADLVAWLWNRYLTVGELTPEQSFAMDRITKRGEGIYRLDAHGLAILRKRAEKLFDGLGFLIEDDKRVDGEK